MQVILTDIDRLLRGQYTEPAVLRLGQIEVPARNLVLAGLLLGSIYGLCMGIYGATRPGNPAVLQLFATTFKVPLLFLLTLLVSLPSLYVLSALAGSKLRFQETMRLLLAAVAINLALLASLGPVVGFFTLSTQSYPFMVLLNVLFFGISGLAGLIFLRRALTHVFTSSPDKAPAEDSATTKQKAPGLRLFQGWLVVYGVVGAQMGWVLRPFIGSPSLEFALFRPRESNFFAGVLNAIAQLFQ